LGLANPDLILLGGDVLFEGDDKNEFPNLWVTNGTAAGTTELTVPNATADGLFLGVIDPDFTVFGSKAVFIGQDDNGQINLWVTNGMNGGTSELNANNEDSGGLFAPSTEPPDFTVLGSEVLFRARDAKFHEGLWVTNGTAPGTSELSVNKANSIGLFASSESPDFTVLGANALFEGENSSGRISLWTINGTSLETTELTTPKLVSPYPDLTVIGNKAVFAGFNTSDVAELWVTDGTSLGTSQLTITRADTTIGPFLGISPDFASLGNKAVFVSRNLGGYPDLAVTNGTPAGTSELTIPSAFSNGLFAANLPPDFVVLGAKALFQGYDLSGHVGLWVTDGTAADTSELSVKLSNAYSGGLLDGAPNFAVFGSEVLFDGVDKSGNLTLWVTNGTSAGTSEVSTVAVAPSDITVIPPPPPPPAPSGLSFAVAADMGTSGDTFTVAGKGEAGDTVTLYDGTTAIGTAVVAAAGTWSITTANPLAVGAHGLSASEVDVAANTSPRSPAQSIMIDSASPDNQVVFVGTPRSDKFSGGAGNDIFQFAAASLTSNDTLIGGGGSDTLMFTTAGTIGVSVFSHVSGIGTIELANGTNNISLGYVAAAPGKMETIVAGTGSDTITGKGVGPGTSLVFEFTAAQLTANDTLVGGGGANTLKFTTPGTVAVLAFSHVSGIGTIDLAPGANNITLGHVAAAPGKTETVVTGTGNDTVTAAGVGAGNTVIVHAGAGADVLTGGPDNDIFYAGGNTTMKGGAGTNEFAFSAPGISSTITNTIGDFTASASNKMLLISGAGFSLPGATATPKSLGSLFVQNSTGTFTATGPTTQRFAYGKSNGNLYYSASGTTATELLVAHLNGDPTLGASQISHLLYAT
jgi:Bacterial Ig-like domain/RTX calcium-binding nonapeptide repeat (4 copies)